MNNNSFSNKNNNDSRLPEILSKISLLSKEDIEELKGSISKEKLSQLENLIKQIK